MPVFNTLFKTSMPKNVKKFLTYGRKKIQLLPPHIYSVLDRFIEYEWFTLEVIKECEWKQTYLGHAILKKGKICNYFKSMARGNKSDLYLPLLQIILVLDHSPNVYPLIPDIQTCLNMISCFSNTIYQWNILFIYVCKSELWLFYLHRYIVYAVSILQGKAPSNLTWSQADPAFFSLLKFSTT